MQYYLLFHRNASLNAMLRTEASSVYATTFCSRPSHTSCSSSADIDPASRALLGEARSSAKERPQMTSTCRQTTMPTCEGLSCSCLLMGLIGCGSLNLASYPDKSNNTCTQFVSHERVTKCVIRHLSCEILSYAIACAE